ncbi:alpha/beta fold hydrolase [Polynucleobacter acidiphobus]|uniref:alpha/beta fold hydrolase n=1 Tax=Polynucleobacter acidiphobus TaxID=556053 RepID=UPI000D3B210B|nr:alpha/beta hydrolase [Polynucleobacter acidiphobus]
MKTIIHTLFCLLLGIGSSALVAQPLPKDCPLTAKTQAVEGGTIHYLQGGAGETVLLLHGLFAQKEQWIEVGCLLTKQGLMVIAPDLPGYGASRPFPQSAYQLERQVELLQRLMQSLQINRFHIGGSSMGGAIAALYTKHNPNQVMTLAFIGAPLGIESWSPQIEGALKKGINPFIPQTSKEFDLEMRLLFAKPPQIDPAIKQSLIQSYVVDRAHYQRVWSIVDQYTRVLEPMRFSHPIFAVWGQHDGVFLVKGATALQERMVKGKVRIDPNSAHLLMLEDPQGLGQQYGLFIKQSKNLAIQ